VRVQTTRPAATAGALPRGSPPTAPPTPLPPSHVVLACDWRVGASSRPASKRHTSTSTSGAVAAAQSSSTQPRRGGGRPHLERWPPTRCRAFSNTDRRRAAYCEFAYSSDRRPPPPAASASTPGPADSRPWPPLLPTVSRRTYRNPPAQTPRRRACDAGGDARPSIRCRLPPPPAPVGECTERAVIGGCSLLASTSYLPTQAPPPAGAVAWSPPRAPLTAKAPAAVPHGSVPLVALRLPGGGGALLACWSQTAPPPPHRWHALTHSPPSQAPTCSVGHSYAPAAPSGPLRLTSSTVPL